MKSLTFKFLLMKKIITLILLIVFPASIFATNEVDTGSTAWMLTSTALVLLMIPGLAMFYGGLVRSKNVLGTMMHRFVAMGIIECFMGGC